MNTDNAFLYVLAGFFALVFATPLLAFWRRKKSARAAVITVLLLSIAACWRYFDLDKMGNTQVAMLVITIAPPLAAATMAGMFELAWWRMRVARRDRMLRHYGHHRRSAPGRASRR